MQFTAITRPSIPAALIQEPDKRISTCT